MVLLRINSKLVELASEMRQHSGTSVSELKRKYNHLVPSNERVLGLVETERNMSLSEVREGARRGKGGGGVREMHAEKERGGRERER